MKGYLLIVAVLFSLCLSYAQCDEYDMDFGIEGKTQIAMATGSLTEKMNNSFLDADDGIVCIGYVFKSTEDALAVSFHKPDGSINDEVSYDGKIIFAPGEPTYGTVGMLTTDNKYFIGGNWSFFSNEQYLFRKYNRDGTLDNTFGVDGEVYPFFSESVIQQVAGISQDYFGNILATGIGEKWSQKWLIFTVMSENGELIIEPKRIPLPLVGDFTAQRQIAYKDQILVSGSGEVNNRTKGVITKLSSGGELDPGFGLNGVYFVPTSLSRPSKIINMASINDESFVALGYHVGSDKNTLFMISLDSKGKIMPDIFENGYTLIDIDKDSHPVDFTIIGEDIYIAANDLSQNVGQVYKVNTQGELISSFGANGIFTLGTGELEKLSRIHHTSDNNVIITGIADNDFTIWGINTCIEVSVDEFPNQNKAFIYPNPTQEVVNLQMKDYQNVDEIRIVSESGEIFKVFHNKELNSNNVSIDVKEWPIGKYYLQFISPSNVYISTFIKI